MAQPTSGQRPVIEKASETGFCCGVRRAVDRLARAAQAGRRIETLGPVVHNPLVVAELARTGVSSVERLDDVRARVVAVTAHGTDPGTLAQIQARNLEVVDTTCSIVRSAQKAAARFARAGYGVLIFGEPDHPEVKGLVGWAGEQSLATTDPGLVGRWSALPARLAVVSQTTQTQQRFQKFLEKLIALVLPRVRELHVVNSTCRVTRERQVAAQELALRSDLVIVVGGRNSANTRRLAETCERMVETRMVESAEEIERGWLEGKSHIGIVGGTSTPDEAIDAVAERLGELTSPDRA